MSPQWLPQNLQKRLLLYVLQQLSLFSEIDLPNLEEVSLNNIHLKDVSIDPEKVGKLPGCNLRYGQVSSLELTGGVMGGVNIEATGLDIVVAPNLDIGEDITKSVQLLLAQSTADLANTIMIDNENEYNDDNDYDNDDSFLSNNKKTKSSPDESNDNNNSDSNSSIKSDRKSTRSSSTSSTTSKPSALGGVMQRAVDMAMLRLLVKMKDLSIKVVSEVADFVVKVDEAFLSTVNGTRSIKVTGTRIVSVHSDVNAGDQEDVEDTRNDKSNDSIDNNANHDDKKSNDDKSSDDNDDSDEDDDDFDYDENETKEEKSLMDSMVFTHEEASSIYMSATSQSFKNSKLGPDTSSQKSIDKLDAVILYVHELDFEFEGLSIITNLFVSIDELILSCSPLVPTVLSVINNVSRGLKLKIYQKRKQSSMQQQQASGRFPQYSTSDNVNPDSYNEKYHDGDDDDDDNNYASTKTNDDAPFFNRLHVSKILVSLTSAIHPDGRFAAPRNNLYLSLQNFNLKQKRDTLKYGGIEVFNLIQTKDGEIQKLFEFETPESESSTEIPKADIRFELFSKISSDLKVNEFTTLLSKVTHINLNSYALSNIMELVSSVNVIATNLKGLMANFESYNLLNSGKTPDQRFHQSGSSIKPFKGRDANSNKNHTDSQIVFQTSNINVNLHLDLFESSKISVQLLPISFNLLHHELKCQKFTVQYLTASGIYKIGSISNIHLSTKSEDFKACSGHGNTFVKDLIMTATTTIKVNKISVEIEMEKLQEIIKLLGLFGDDLKANPVRYELNSIPASANSTLRPTASSVATYNPKKLRKRVTINNLKLVCDFRVVLDAVNFDLHKVKGEIFGSLITKLDTFQIFKYNGDYNLMLNDLLVIRSFGDHQQEKLLYNFEDLSATSKKASPMVTGSTKNGGLLEIKLRHFVFEYYTHWLKLFLSDEPSTSNPSTNDTNSADTNSIGGAKTSYIDKTLSIEPETIKELRKTDIRIQWHDCALGITPFLLPCRSAIVINKLHSDVMIGNDQIYAKTTMRDLSLLLVDSAKELKSIDSRGNFSKSPMTWYLKQGFLCVGSINNLHIGVTFNVNKEKLALRQLSAYNKSAVFDIKLNVDEVNLEVCGDSFYTFTQLFNDLKIPLILSDLEKFKVSLDHDINVFEGIEELFDMQSREAGTQNENLTPDELQFDNYKSDNHKNATDDDNNFEIVDEYYDKDQQVQELSDRVENLELSKEQDNAFEIHDNYFNRVVSKTKVNINPVSINVNLGSFNLYMYDGYDWKQTRQVIKGVVKKVEKESKEDEVSDANNDSVNHSNAPMEAESDDGDELLDVIEETLFQSIHVTLPKGINPNHLATNINKQVNEEDIESHGYKDLKLRRSNKYKMLIELKNIDINMNILSIRDPIKDPITNHDFGKEYRTNAKHSTAKDCVTDDFEVLNEVEVLVDTVTIYDNLVNSTWNKYLTYMSSMGEKEIGKHMVKLNIITSREPANLNFNETIMKLSILPIRLFIDQDTNEFMVRFFKFNDSRFHLAKLEEDIYLKKFEIANNLKVKIDYKPKKVNLIGLKNGEFNQLLNLININGLAINLNCIKLYGLKGIDNLFVRLFEYWLPNIQQTQLINLFNGVELFRPVISISESFRNFMAVPVNEFEFNDLNNPNFYKQLNKSGKEFLKTTSYELLKLGYKLSNGTQNLLEQGEEMLGGSGSKSRLYKQGTNSKDRDRTSGSKSMSMGNREYEDSDASITASNTASNANLLENSIRLNKNVSVESNIYSSHKKYSEVEDEEYESSDEELEETKLISLYSNQPKNFKQGVKLSFNSINKNYNLTKGEFLKLLESVNETSNYEESVKLLLRKSPLLLLRPMIGTTEILLKTLMGLSNEINSVDQIESKDKYKSQE